MSAYNVSDSARNSANAKQAKRRKPAYNVQDEAARARDSVRVMRLDP